MRTQSAAFIVLLMVLVPSGRNAYAQLSWKDVDERISFIDKGVRPFEVGTSLFVNVEAPPGVGDQVWMRIFRGKQETLATGGRESARDTGDNCLLYDSILMRPRHLFGLLSLEDWHITTQWLRVAASDVLAEEFFFIRLEPTPSLTRGPLKIPRSEIHRYFGHGQTIRVTVPQGLTRQQMNAIVDAIRHNQQERSHGLDAHREPCRSVMTTADHLRMASAEDCPKQEFVAHF